MFQWDVSKFYELKGGITTIGEPKTFPFVDNVDNVAVAEFVFERLCCCVANRKGRWFGAAGVVG